MIDNERIGIFGGTFNPIHVGHVNSAVTVAKKMGLQKVFVIPTYETPNRPAIEGPTPEQRFEMTRLGLQNHSDTLIADDREIKRGGLSYTYQTIEEFAQDYSGDCLHLIIGMDVFYELDSWKNPDSILEQANLIVTTRPGEPFPSSREDFPEVVKKFLTEDFRRGHAGLSTGRMIDFVRLDDIEISSTDLRKKLRRNGNVDRFLDYDVEAYIKSKDLYHSLSKRIQDFGALTKLCASRAIDSKGIGVSVYEFNDNEAPCDFTMIASGTSSRHTQTMAEKIRDVVKEEYGVNPLAIEGTQEGRWIVLDYGGAIIHVFYDYVRQEYRLEELWQNGKTMDLSDLQGAPGGLK